MQRGKLLQQVVQQDRVVLEGYVLVLQRENHVQRITHVEGEYVKKTFSLSLTDRVLYSDGADLSCMVQKMKGASRHMHLISEMHLIEKLRGMIGVTGELDCSSAYIRLREPDKSKDKAEIEAMELHTTGIDELLIKIAKSERLRVDAGVLNQETKEAVHSVVPFLLRGVDDNDDREDGTIPKASRTIKDLLQVGGLQVGVIFCSFRAKLLAFRKFDGSGKENYNS
ncbi:hypothetical protein BHE74_00012198 [Ensete ventricosum]|nr:hypothetical protein GW17_00018009 [Ensete ventricosum]RWW79510.1 hypothetical protein BHE74_00012198 [Ensete ventricosum]